MKKISIGISLLLFALMILPSFSFSSTTIIVPDNYPTIQGGIDAAATGDTVLVRDGTYLLSAALDFKGKAITVVSEHGASSCFLDGQNTTRVVYFHSGEGTGSVLSGFTIQNGKASQGGGIYCSSSSPTITYCTIRNNTANNSEPSQGGGLYLASSSPIISNCIFSGNIVSANAIYVAHSYGGGIYVTGGAPIIRDSVLTGNSAALGATLHGGTYSAGGGIYCESSSPSITNTIFSQNSASAASNTSLGGGMIFSTSVPSIVNCIIDGNSANLGAGIYFDSSSAFSNLINCTIVRNTASTHGGSFYCANTSLKVVNSILWENSPEEVYNDGTSNPTITYSEVYGGYTGTGNIDTYPNFVSIAQQDYHLASSSPARNAGNNAAPELPSYDKDGSARIIDGTVDMGAYEYSSSESSDVIVYPQLAVGGGYEVVIIVSNKSASSWSGTGKPLKNDGSMDYLATQITLGPKETKKYVLTGGSTTKACGFEIYGDNGSPNSAVSVNFFYNYYQDEALQDSTGVPKSQLAKKYTFPVERTSTVDTGLSIRRRADQPTSQVVLTLIDASGNQLQQVHVGSDSSGFFTQLFTEVPSSFMGSVVAESPDEFYMVVIRMENTRTGFQLTSVPPEAN